MIAMAASAIGPQMLRESASPEKNAAWMMSSPSGLSTSSAASSIDIQGQGVLTVKIVPFSRLGADHTIIITGFSISCLKAPISSAPSAPSLAR